ncbi:HzsA-related protein [Pontiella sulfatireligans]|uniref:Hydrazine synthase alpha subunit middle domain-containing protein n=1 Tax=Pontiella sulfatireligans TaxID=2750658 RepID=A0A6C2UIK6_9BACT|nr:hypothetical protein [Pontiella sulfatireligans]VGO19287.1 hypothetical protein SCARR_01345 [Pontiella sulfatireligans]
MLIPSTIRKLTGATLLLAGISHAEFQPQAAQTLLDAGVRELLFTKRFTLDANHVYTEYVNSKWKPGGNIFVLNLETGNERELVPSLAGGVFNRFDLSFDAKKVVFDYKKSNGEGYRIYEVNIDGSGLKQLTFPEPNEQELIEKYSSKGYHHGTDDLHPCCLPDGGIVFATTRCQYSILCNSSDVFTTKNLYRMDGDGNHMRALSNSSVSEASPVVMPDGRILYHRWEYVDKAAGNLKCLWAMKPDGSASVEIYGNTISHPETMIYPRPVPGAENKIAMLGTTHWGPNNAMGTVIVVDTSKNIRSTEAMEFVTKDVNALGHAGFYFKDENGKWFMDKTGTLGRLFKDPYPLSEKLFIVSHKPKGLKWNEPAGYDLSLLNENGADTLLYRDPAISCWHPFPLMPRKKPPVPGSDLSESEHATCVVTDVYEGMEQVEPGTIKHLRIMEQVPRPWAARNTWFKSDRDGMAHTALGHGILGLKVQHGIVPVEADGSAHFTVPSERNIYFQALDKNYMAIQTERTYVNYMPGETRSCVGCHELPNSAPAHRGKVQALTRAPSTPQPQPGEETAQKVFDYPRQIQPIWDAHCIECHGNIDPKAELNLTGNPAGTYSVSYNNLVRRPKGRPGLLGSRELLNENVGSAGIEYLPPYSSGSPTSLLLAIHANGRFKLRDPDQAALARRQAMRHRGVALSDEEFIRIANWIDANGQFHPSYWGRKNAKFAEHPNYRPEVTLADAVSRSVPPSIATNEANN